jgi:hypothetical protein
MTITILLGNGFNYSIKDFIESHKDDYMHLLQNIAKLIKAIEGITELWGELNKLVDTTNVDENLIEDIHKSFTFLSLIKPFENEHNLKNCVKELKEKFNKSFIETLWKIIHRFLEYESKGFYQDLTKLSQNIFNDYNYIPCQKIRGKNVNLYTTNYDGIAEIILGYDGKQLSLPDMFRGCDSDYYVCFSKKGYEEDKEGYKLFHLHGSYKFFAYKFFLPADYEEIKIKREHINFVKENKNLLEPIIVLNAPSIKEKQIERFEVLKSYFSVFKTDLQKSEKLIIWGQSLEYDPHLLKAIEEHFVRNKDFSKREIIIVDIDFSHKILRLFNSKDFEHQTQQNYKVFKHKQRNTSIKVKFINAQQKNFIDILKEILDET